jgi:hypothetical protein
LCCGQAAWVRFCCEDGDVEALAPMLGLAEEIDTAIGGAVKGLRGCGYSWAEIGTRLGITRLAAQQRWEG